MVRRSSAPAPSLLPGSEVHFHQRKTRLRIDAQIGAMLRISGLLQGLSSWY